MKSSGSGLSNSESHWVSAPDPGGDIGPVTAHISELLAFLEPGMKFSLEQKQKLASV